VPYTTLELIAGSLKNLFAIMSIIGTDYGHNDTASELVALRKLREDGKIDPATAAKFLDGNPRRLYGL